MFENTIETLLKIAFSIEPTNASSPHNLFAKELHFSLHSHVYTIWITNVCILELSLACSLIKLSAYLIV